MSPDTIELLTSSEFAISVAIGITAAAITGVLGVMSLRKRGITAPVAGLFLVAGLIVASADHMSVLLLAGLVLLAVAGALRVPRSLQAVLAVPGALLIAASIDVGAAQWLLVLVAVSVPILGLLAADLDARYKISSYGPALFVVSTVGLFFAVPDTERALTLMGVAGPFVLLALPRPLASLGSPGAFAVVGAFVWTATVGATGRPAIAVPAVAALGLLIVEPVVSRLMGWRWPLRGGTPILVVGAQLITVYLAARVAASSREPLTIGVLTAVALLAGTAFVYGLDRRMGRRETAA